MRFRYLVVFVCCLAFTAVSVSAQEDAQKAEAPAGVNVGDAAPVFAGTDDMGEVWKSADHVGDNMLVVYFFPAAMTGG